MLGEIILISIAFFILFGWVLLAVFGAICEKIFKEKHKRASSILSTIAALSLIFYVSYCSTANRYKEKQSIIEKKNTPITEEKLRELLLDRMKLWVFDGNGLIIYPEQYDSIVNIILPNYDVYIINKQDSTTLYRVDFMY